MAPSPKKPPADFRYLLARGYPRKAALTLVGNRYRLDEIARPLLHRGVFAPEVAEPAGPGCACSGTCRARPLALDGHNVLITLECAARSLPLVAAHDGFIRDVG